MQRTVISIFAGCGGSTLGYRAAGFDERLAVEWDKDAVKTFERNFPGLPIYAGDVNDLSVDQCLELAGLDPGQLDVLDGSPPCQGFSTVGRRNTNDERSQLYRQFTRLLDGLQPQAFVVENVKGMLIGSMQSIFLDMMAELRSCGYRVKAQVLNAMYFGTPQRRSRLIVVGFRNDLDMDPDHPKPQTAPVTFVEACGDFRGDRPDDRYLLPMVKWLAKEQPRKWGTDKRVFKRITGKSTGGFSIHWADWHTVCGTITSEGGWAGIVHPDRRRHLSLREAIRIGGFPDNFQFSSRKLGIKRIANSVPPPLMEAIARHIKGRLDGRQEKGRGQNPHGKRENHTGEPTTPKAKAKAQGTTSDQAAA